MDFGGWAQDLPVDETIELSQKLVHVLHDVYRFRWEADSPAPDVIISGHTHRPLNEQNQGVLYINPGSAGYPKFGQPATVALLRIKGQSLQVQFVELKD
jgi:putative phosphoesterase